MLTLGSISLKLVMMTWFNAVEVTYDDFRFNIAEALYDHFGFMSMKLAMMTLSQYR